MRVWTSEEEDIFKTMYANKEYEMEDISKCLDRSFLSLRGKAITLNITRNVKRWKTKYDDFLIENYKKLGTEKCAEILGYSTDHISKKITLLGLRGKTISFWTREEREELQELANKHYTRKEIAEKMDKTIIQIGNKLRILGLNSNSWNDDEILFLKENYNSHNAISIAKQLNRKKMAIYRKASELGITQIDNLGSNHYAFKEDKRDYPAEWTMKLRRTIRERDDYRCQVCNKTQDDEGIALQVHHIDYIKENLDESNLISLCRECHGKTNINRNQWQLFFLSLLKEKERGKKK